MKFGVTQRNDVTATDESSCVTHLAPFWWKHSTPFGAKIRDVSPQLSTPKIRTSVDLIAQADIKDLSGVMRQLVELQRGPSEDHRGTLRPSTYAFERCVTLLVDASVTLYLDHGQRVPLGMVSPDFEGGLRIEWVYPEISVHLVVAASEDGQNYIYHEEATDFGVEEELTADRLASWLQLICQ